MTITFSLEVKENKRDLGNQISSKVAYLFKNFYEENFDKVLLSMGKNAFYHDFKNKALINKIPKGLKVLEIGCWTGDLLTRLEPSFGVGVDLCGKAISQAKKKHTSENLKFIEGDFFNGEIRNLIGDCKFDAIVVLNTLGQVSDVISFLKTLHSFCHSKTRIYVYGYNRMWQPLYRLGEIFGLKVKSPEESWLPPEELKQMFYLTDLQEVSINYQLLFPFYIPVISKIINKFFAHLPLFENLSMIVGFVLRPIGEKYKSEKPLLPSCSVVIPCRNEAGHIQGLVERLPDLAPGSEYIFIEGNSTDNTEEVIKNTIRENPHKSIKFLKQIGKGKGDAVRLGFANAKGDILAILDADITVPPEDLPNFINLLVENRAEFVNGSRLVYPMEKEAMRFLNMLANKFFAYLFSFLLGHQLRDTLCGTKVLWKKDYENIVRNRSYFGDFDPFGDFDLIFGAAKLNLKIIDLPIRYAERTYGETNISRFRHGWLLLQMSLFAFKKLKMV